MDKLLPKNKVVGSPVYKAISKSGRADEVVGSRSARICAYEPSLPKTGPCYGTKDSWLPGSPNVGLTKDKKDGDDLQIQLRRHPGLRRGHLVRDWQRHVRLPAVQDPTDSVTREDRNTDSGLVSC